MIGRDATAALRGLSLALLLAAAVASAPSVAHAMPGGVAIVGARIVEAHDRDPIEDGVIVIEAGVIRHVGTRGEVTLPADYPVLNWQGLTVLPGYWNAHVHLTTPAYLQGAELGDADLEAELTRTFVRWGFTTVFDLASTTAISESISARVEQGRVRGPRILSVAEPFYPADGTPIYARPYYERFNLPSAEVADAQAAVARARAQIRGGADGLKLFAGSIIGENDVALMPAAIVRGLADAAEAHDVPSFAHPTNQAGLELAIENGVDVLAHAAPLMGEWSPELARRISQRGTAMIPTLSLFALDPHPLTPVSVAVQQTRALEEAGGTILFGTDAGFVDAFSPELEMVLLEEAVGWRGVIAALTAAPARLFGDEGTEGRIAAGYVADLVGVGCDPRETIRCLADVRWVMKDGAILYQGEAAAGRSEEPR